MFDKNNYRPIEKVKKAQKSDVEVDIFYFRLWRILEMGVSSGIGPKRTSHVFQFCRDLQNRKENVVWTDSSTALDNGVSLAELPIKVKYRFYSGNHSQQCKRVRASSDY